MRELLVPFRFGEDPARDRAWQYVRDRYQEHHPDLRLRVGCCFEGEPWSKGVAVGRAFERAESDVFAIADADVLAQPGALTFCFDAVEDGAPWSQPHDMVYRLAERATDLLYESPELTTVQRFTGRRALERRPHVAAPGGGLVVLTRRAYEAVGGIDPRFIGWGGEDISFAHALDTLVGRCVRRRGPLWHLWHPRAARRPGNRASVESEQLAVRYLLAAQQPSAMRELVSQASQVSR